MRRGVICFLAFCLLACLVTVTAPEAKAAEHSHCVCGGHAKGIGDHVCTESVTWEPWDGTTTLVDGHSYYLNDTDGDGVIQLDSTININGICVNICLNGIELRSTARVFLLNSTVGIQQEAKLSICDCHEESQWGSVTSTNTGIAPVLHSYTSDRADVTINLYSGNLTAKDQDMDTADKAAGVFRLGNNTKASGDAVNHTGTFNMYGGSISGGMTAADGGNLYVSIDCYFNMYGGTITGGQTGARGGNVFVGGHMNMRGGTISGGTATGLGGGVYLSGGANHKATITVGGTAQIIDNTTSNLYLPETMTVTIGTLAKPARIGVTPVTTSNFASTTNESDARYFFSDNGKYAVVWSDGVLKLGSHNHCVCGGSADHSCEDSSWTSLTAALAAKSMTPDTADFGKLAAGNYFLDCDVTVTGATNLTKNISLCLNGYSISREEGKIFGYLKNGYTLNICDCSGEQVDGAWQWDGSVNGGTNIYGSVIYTHYGSTLNIYGGNFTGKGTSNGGVIVAANDGAPDLNDDGIVSNEEKNQATPSVFNFYNGIIYGSQSATKNSTVVSYHSAVIYWHSGQLRGGLVGGIQEAAVIMEGNRLIPGSYITLENAIAKATDGRFVRLISDIEENITISGSVYLDLNGYNLSGITVEGTLYAFDTTGGGVLSCTGTPVLQHTYNGVSYMALPNAGSWSFHHGSAQITKISLKPGNSGMGYKAQFEADDVLARSIQSYGYQLWLEGYPIHTYSSKEFVSGKELTLRLQNVMSSDNDLLTNLENASMKVHARAFVRLNDGTMIQSAVASYDLRQMLELADTHYSTFTDVQKDALQTMFTNYENILIGWDIPNIIGWTQVDAAGFEALLTYSGDYNLSGVDVPYYTITPGKYILTEDITLTDRMVQIGKNAHTSINLNGHTISSNTRVFQVRGTVDICDSTGQGTITSSYSPTSGYAPIAYIYNGTMNLYSGNLTATGEVSSAGVLAVGKSGDTSGTLNIFGGTVSGGKAKSNSGLIALWDKSSMNMYGGTLTNGSCDGIGGAISVGVGSHACLYGGKIYGNTAETNGGGVYVNGGETEFFLGKQMVIRDNTASKGGNVYCNSDLDITVDGSTITGGTANMGGGLYRAGGSITLQGDAVIRDNTGGNLYVLAGVGVDAAGLSENADISLYNMSAMALSGSEYITLERSGYKLATIGGQTVLIPESFTVPTDVEGFQVGFGRADITPEETGLPLAGYGNASERLSTTTAVNAYDELKVSCVAITDENGETVLLMSVDLIRPNQDLMNTIFPAVSAATGVPQSNIFTTFTHTHSVPEIKSTTDEKIQRYNAMLPDRFAESANLAMADRAPATMETGSFEVGDYGKLLNFTRHYQYEEDGVVKYFGDNFGTATINDTTKHVTEADHTMHLVKFTREGKDILMANWRVHPHMTGGGSKTVVSADIIGTTRYYMESETDYHFIYLQGAAGNVNETSKIESEKHGYTYEKYGEDLANQIQMALSAQCLTTAEVGLWQIDNYSYTATADKPTEEEYNHAKTASDTFYAWLAENPSATSAQKKAKCEELGYLTWFHFNNVITRHGLNETYQLPLNTFSLGSSLAFFTAPGELWDTVSMEIEEASPFNMTLSIGYSQDHYNYFVYDPNNGGEMTYESYESNNYRFVAPDTVNDFIAYWKATLDQLYANLEK